jgi:hypothetical protein
MRYESLQKHLEMQVYSDLEYTLPSCKCVCIKGHLSATPVIQVFDQPENLCILD